MRGVTSGGDCSATKISVRFLDAIEAEEFTKLPWGHLHPQFHADLCRYLGLDEERVLAEYQLAPGPRQEARFSPDGHQQTVAFTNQGSRTPFWRCWWQRSC